MLRASGCLLVVASEASLRAEVAQLFMPLGYRVELASTEKAARQLIKQERFTAAIMAPAAVTLAERALLEEVHAVVDKLVLLAACGPDAAQLAAAFPLALICASHQLDREKLLAFLGRLGAAPASGAEQASAVEHWHFANCSFDVTGHVFRDGRGREVALTRGEFTLLTAFVRSPGRPLTRAQLRQAMDGGELDVYDRSVDMLVARLRRKIEPDPAKPQFVVTVPGAGYKFAPRLHRGEPPAAAAKPVVAEPDAHPAERRLLTMLSCQILGFASLAAASDPEDVECWVRPVYAACADVIRRFDGAVVRNLGDTVLAHFGHPTAHEDDAERAVRAALELLHVIGSIPAGPAGQFRARIGIASGLMVVGDLSAAGGPATAAIGEAVNMAVHMQTAAVAGSVVIAASTRRLIGRFFHCEAIASVFIEQDGEPVEAWRVLEALPGMPRFEALRRDGMLDLVGRTPEMQRLRHCWSEAAGGLGQVVWLTGEAGIGKSRLVVELAGQLEGDANAILRFAGSPQRTDAPMSALINELQRSAGIGPAGDTDENIASLQREFAPLGAGAAEATALGCILLGLPHATPAPISQLSAAKRKERTFAALLARIETMASRQPVLAVVEDAHWVDPTSLEFICLLVERANTMRLLLVVVGRPEFVPPWPDHSYLTTLWLRRLSPADSGLLIQHAAGAQRVSDTVAIQIAARADGVPLFVEELTKSVLETTAYKSDVSPNGLAAAGPIPTTLHGLLLARCDRLEGGKQVAQAGAVIGRDFSFELLRMVGGLDQPALIGALDRLVSSGLVFRRGVPPHATFVFKHALVRDAAYQTLLRQQRCRLHGEVAQAYEQRFPETAAAQPDLLGYHWREAGHAGKAAGYLVTAGERALSRSACAEALAHLGQARDLLSTLPDDSESLELALRLEIALGRALMEQHGYAGPETRAAYRRAGECCRRLDDRERLPLIILAQWVSAWIAADHNTALTHAQELRAWGERHGEPAGLAVGDLGLGMTLALLGDLTRARQYLEEALRINRFVLPGQQQFVASDTDGVSSALAYLHDCLLLLGFGDEAKAVLGQALQLQPQHLYSRALLHIHLARVHALAGDPVRAGAAANAAVQLAEQQGYPEFRATGMVFAGWALAHQGDAAAGVALCERGLAQLPALGSVCWRPLYLSLLAECCERAGDLERAAQTVEEALASVAATGERIWASAIYRQKGDLLRRARGDREAAQKCFAQALTAARQCNARLLELQAATRLV